MKLTPEEKIITRAFELQSKQFDFPLFLRLYKNYLAIKKRKKLSDEIYI